MKHVIMKEVYSQATQKHDKSRKILQFFTKKWKCCAAKIDPPSQHLQELRLKSLQRPVRDKKQKKTFIFAHFLQKTWEKT